MLSQADYAPRVKAGTKDQGESGRGGSRSVPRALLPAKPDETIYTERSVSDGKRKITTKIMKGTKEEACRTSV